MAKKDESDGFINLAAAIKEIQKQEPWWKEVSIRKEVREGKIPHRKGSLSAKAKYYVRLEDLEAYVKKLKVDQTTAQSNIEAMNQ